MKQPDSGSPVSCWLYSAICEYSKCEFLQCFSFRVLMDLESILCVNKQNKNAESEFVLICVWHDRSHCAWENTFRWYTNVIESEVFSPNSSIGSIQSDEWKSASFSPLSATPSLVGNRTKSAMVCGLCRSSPTRNMILTGIPVLGVQVLSTPTGYK